MYVNSKSQNGGYSFSVLTCEVAEDLDLVLVELVLDKLVLDELELDEFEL